MKILHLCLGNFYVDNYSYQENLLPKYHGKQGHDVQIVASLETFDENGKPTRLEAPTSYINEHGIHVTRLPYRNFFLSKILRCYRGLGRELARCAPDILFVHNVQFLDALIVRRYARKNRGVRLYIDNHADFSNSARSFWSRWILHGVLWKWVARSIKPYTAKFYGVLPARVDFLKQVYGLKSDDVELLVMGADDEEVEASLDPRIRGETRLQLGVGPDDFLIVTGGKIDFAKLQTFALMHFVKNAEDPSLKLVVFGSVLPELNEKLMDLSGTDRVNFVGWANATDSYRYFAAADLVVFPGRHSVYWEQACGMGKPLVVKRWPGTDHVDFNGNCRFLESDDMHELSSALQAIIYDAEVYRRMLETARGNAMRHFSYAHIAARSIGEPEGF